jgi:predicted Zn-ribbon and HTH transcriptional regulator
MKCRKCGEEFEPKPGQDIPICGPCWEEEMDESDFDIDLEMGAQ